MIKIDRNDLVTIFNRLNRLKTKYEDAKTKGAFDTFNFKVYDFFYDENNTFELIKKLGFNLDNEMYFYLQDRFETFEIDFKEMFDIEYKQLYRTSTCYLESDNIHYSDSNEITITSRNDSLIDFLNAMINKEEYYTNDLDLDYFFNELEKYNNKQIITNIVRVYNSKDTDLNLKYILSDISDLETDFKEFLKAQEFIKNSKKNVTNMDFLNTCLYNATNATNVNFKELDNLILRIDVLDSELFDNCIITDLDNNKKEILYSYYCKPIVVTFI